MSCIEHPVFTAFNLLMFSSGFFPLSFPHHLWVCIHSSHFSGLFGLLVFVVFFFLVCGGFIFLHIYFPLEPIGDACFQAMFHFHLAM